MIFSKDDDRGGSFGLSKSNKLSSHEN